MPKIGHYGVKTQPKKLSVIEIGPYGVKTVHYMLTSV